MAAPIERKVVASTAGAVIAAFLLWVLDTYVFTGTGVPEQVEGLIQLLVLGLVTFASGWAAKHTVRNDPDAHS